MSVPVNKAAESAVHRKMIELYAEVATKNYQQLADQFNTAATEFTTVVATVDPEAAAETLITAPAKEREAWSRATLLSGTLDGLIPALRAAADLAGTSTRDEPTLVGLLVYPNGAHRRRLWEAWWSKTGRTGRWGAIIKAGAKIRAAELADVHPYRGPRPLERRQEERDGRLMSALSTPKTKTRRRSVLAPGGEDLRAHAITPTAARRRVLALSTWRRATDDVVARQHGHPRLKWAGLYPGAWLAWLGCRATTPAIGRTPDD